MKKNAVITPADPTPLQKRALEQLCQTLLDYSFTYPVCVTSEEQVPEGCRRFYLGTGKNSPALAAVSDGSLTKPESYRILVRDDTVYIEGADDAGVLYGAIDFYNEYLLRSEYPDTDSVTYRKNPLEKERLSDFDYRSAPSVKERGLWTWGHVIYDYKGYLDHMMLLKMNQVVIWNDYAPANAEEILRYAHERNIQVIWGFSWLWDVNCHRTDLTNLEEVSRRVFATFEKEYASICPDGIYFQTFTEVHGETIGGKLIAEVATDFVNRTAALFYEKYPSLRIQFGLHAMSVKQRLEFIAKVDRRIQIVWEDCGAFPFSYFPRDVEGFEDTMALVERMARLRGREDRFGVVTKGLVKLDWSKFEHSEGPHVIGVSTLRMKENRIARKRPEWKYVQAGWLSHADKAYEAVRRMQRAKDGELSVCALVEDGMFEEVIPYPVALFAQMLWNCSEELKGVQNKVALRHWVRFF